MRVPVDVLVHVSTNGLRIADKATDLSEGGIGVVTSSPIAPRTVVDVRLELPHSDGMVDLKGHVIWATSESMGIRFETHDCRLADSVERVRRELDSI